MNKQKAVQTISNVFDVLQTIPVSGEQNTSNMAGVFQALKAVHTWLDELELEDKEIENNENIQGEV